MDLTSIPLATDASFDYLSHPFGLTERLLVYLSHRPGASRSSIINYLSFHFHERPDSIVGALRTLTLHQHLVESVSYRMRNVHLDVGPTRYWLASIPPNVQRNLTSIANSSSLKDNHSLNETSSS